MDMTNRSFMDVILKRDKYRGKIASFSSAQIRMDASDVASASAAAIPDNSEASHNTWARRVHTRMMPEVAPLLAYLRHAMRLTAAVAIRPSQRPAAPTQNTTGIDRDEVSPQTGQSRWRRPLSQLSHLPLETLVALVATMLSVTAYVWYAQQGLTLAYEDSISHMMIARRVLFGRTSGLGQLGAAWLPLPHLLMLPFVWNDWMFHTGLAGALPSMAAYVITAVYAARLGRLAFQSKWAGWLAALVVMLNPDVLYMQSTPMSEVELLATTLVAVYYLVRWAHMYRETDLVKCALAVATGTLIRFDGWALACAIAVVVGILAWRRAGRMYAEAQLLLYSILGFAGCISYLIYQQVIFGNALEFYNGTYSAQAQQAFARSTSILPTYHNTLFSAHTYAQAAVDTIGVGLTAIALLGFCLYVAQMRRPPRLLPMLVVLVPFAFNWLALYIGIIIVQTPEIAFNGMHTYFNERYGMMMIPAAAVFIAYWAARSRLLVAPLIALVLASSVIGGVVTTPYVLGDPLQGVTSHRLALAAQEGAWLREHCSHSAVLISGGSFEAAMFDSNLPDAQFITDSNAAAFQSTLAHPQQAGCVVMDPQAPAYDPVWAALHNRQDWRGAFVLRAVVGTTQLYERLSTASPAGGSASVFPRMQQMTPQHFVAAWPRSLIARATWSRLSPGRV